MFKKLFYLFTALALFSACDTLDDWDLLPGGDTADLPQVIYATIDEKGDESEKGSNKMARTYVENKKSVLWHGGDNITYFYDFWHQAQYKYNGEDGVAAAEFTPVTAGTRGFELSRSYAVYPFEAGASCVKDNGGVEKLQVYYPAEQQTYEPNSFGRGANVMVAAGKHPTDINLNFRNACGYLIIKLYGEDVTVKSIELTALGGEKIAGKGLITATNDAAPEVEMTDQGISAITLHCPNGVTLGADAAHATEFWFALPPTTFNEGFKIYVVPAKGMAFEMQTSKKVEITRNDIQPMAALQFKPNAQSPNQFFYTRSDDSKEPTTFHETVGDQPFNSKIIDHYYDENIKQFIIECDAPITEIKDYAFIHKKIGSVSLPNQLKTIGLDAFFNTDLVEVVIPGSVTMIKYGAFRECFALQRLTLLWGEEVLEVRASDSPLYGRVYGAFMESRLNYIYVDRNIIYRDHNGEDFTPLSNQCGLFTHESRQTDKDVDEVIIGPNMSTIIESMFAGVYPQKLVIPGNITSIENNAFYNSYELEELIFEPSPTGTPLTMGYSPGTISDSGPFYLSNSSVQDDLKTIRLNREINYTLNNINSKDKGVFSDRRALTTVELGEQVKTISDYMFAVSPKLTSVNIPTSVTSIGNNAFEECAITSVNIPETVTSMGNNVFRNCDALKNATLGTPTIGTGVLYDCDALEEVTIKGTVNSFGEDAFYSCGALKRLTLEPSPTNTQLRFYVSEEESPFYDAALESVDWDRDIIYSGGKVVEKEGLFSGQTQLSSVTIGNQVKTIPYYAFANNSKLTSITIPESVTTILYDAFKGCSALHTVIIRPSDEFIKIYCQKDGDGTFYDAKLKHIELGRYIEAVNEYGNLYVAQNWNEGVFANSSYSSVDEVTVIIGEKITNINEYMFSHLNIKTLTVPSTVGLLERYAFYNCDALKTVTLGAQQMESGVLYDCDALEEVIIKGTVSSIGRDAFYSCGKIKKLTFEESATSSTLTLDYQTYASDDQGPFYDAPLEEVDWRRNISYTLANAGTVNGKDEGLFSGKSTLTKVNIGAQVKSIPPYTFAGSGFTAIWIPREVTSIGNNAFEGCSNFLGLTCNHSTPPTLGTNAFENCGKFYYISVLEGSENAFKTAPGWSEHASKIRTWKP